mmetsp:Transcript_20135/g.61250  ORF Transcript_20135/g.61250 Transcript_20135/m.61250 type:complete len:227 (+) Transcript_20135:477-1157(+)
MVGTRIHCELDESQRPEEQSRGREHHHSLSSKTNGWVGPFRLGVLFLVAPSLGSTIVTRFFAIAGLSVVWLLSDWVTAVGVDVSRRLSAVDGSFFPSFAVVEPSLAEAPCGVDELAAEDASTCGKARRTAALALLLISSRVRTSTTPGRNDPRPSAARYSPPLPSVKAAWTAGPSFLNEARWAARSKALARSQTEVSSSPLIPSERSISSVVFVRTLSERHFSDCK